jgi:hypothetical protein
MEIIIFISKVCRRHKCVKFCKALREQYLAGKNATCLLHKIKLRKLAIASK